MKRKIKININRGKALVLATIVLFTGIVASKPFFASSIDDEKKKQQELESELQDSQSMLNDLESLKSDTQAYIAAVDEKLNTITAHINDLNDQAAAKQAEIDQTTAQLAQKEQEISEQYAAMKVRIQYMFENGDSDYLDMVLNSKSFSEILNKAEYISELTSYDRRMLEKLEQTRQEIQTAKDTLESDKKNLDELTASAQAEQASMQALIEDKTAQLNATESQISSAESDIADKQGEIEASKKIVQELEELERQRREEAARKAAEAAAAGSTDDSGVKYDGGVFNWPLPGYYSISSPYGYRVAPDTNNPSAGSSEFHSGIDIPAPTGTPVIAAYSGEIAWAYRSSSAGNWIGIDHGDGLSTVYMHMSSLAVSKGQYVNKGDTIGYVGSTGWSTGSHLHFSVRLNGNYVDPMGYVSN